jgi:hypothetical protein
MANAAQRAFAIPELLEQILLYVYEDDMDAYFGNPRLRGELDDDVHKLGRMNGVKRLFVLQRVNHSFEGTILGSCHLKRLMFPEYAQTEELDRDQTGAWNGSLLHAVGSCRPSKGLLGKRSAREG